MQSRQDFKTYYDTTLLPLLTSLDRERKSLINKVFLFAFIGIAGGVAGAMLIGVPGFFLTIIVAGVIFALLYGGKFKVVKERFKKEIIAHMVTSIDASLVYEHNRFIPQSEYNKSKLFLSNINRYKGDDFVQGTVGKTAIRFSELLTQLETRRVNNGKTQTSVTTIFRGIFFIADFNKKFVGETFVVPDNAEKLLGSFGTIFQKMTVGRPPLVKLEDIAFEKEFCVYGTDQVEARYILSTALMQRIMEFKNRFNTDIFISFVDSQIFIAISVWKNLFEAPLLRSMINYKRMTEYHQYLSLCIGIVEVLDLNTRIWTKE